MTLPRQRAHAFWPTLQGRPTAAATASQTTPLTLHGGWVQDHTSTYAIFWLPAGYSYERNASGSSTRYESLIMRYLRDIGGSTFYNPMTQYYDSSSWITNRSTFTDAVVDSAPYPVRNGSVYTTDADIQQEVAKVIRARNWPYGAWSQFFVFTASGVQTWAQIAGGWSNNGSTGYCAYHSFFTGSTYGLGNYPVVYGNIPDQDGHLPCSTHSGSAYFSPNGDLTADSMISTTSHEQFEMVTDPVLNAWKDSDGFEIGDKCAYIFGTPGSDGGNVTLNGHRYILQAEFSNDVLRTYGYTGCTLGRSLPYH